MDLLQTPRLLLTHEMVPNRQSLIVADVRIGTIKAHVPDRQPRQQLVQSRLIAITTLPIDQLTSIPAEGQPNPQFVAFVSNKMPDFIQFHDDHTLRPGLRLCRPLPGKLAHPVQDRRGDHRLQERNRIQRQTAQIQKNGLDVPLLLFWIGLSGTATQARLPAAGLAFPLWYTACRAVLDQALTTTIRTWQH